MSIKSLSKKTRQLILGTTLGDGHLRRQAINTRLEVAHSPKQKEYLFWKYNILKKDGLTKSEPRIIVIKYNGKKYPQWRFQTLSLSVLNDFHHLFYVKSKKMVRRKALNRLEPLGLAVWYMDDGNIAIHKQSKSREIYLNTQQCSYEEHLIIRKYFKMRWKIQVRIIRNKGSFRIAMNATEGKKFLEIVKPYIINCMKYKIDLGYKN